MNPRIAFERAVMAARLKPLTHESTTDELREHARKDIRAALAELQGVGYALKYLEDRGEDVGHEQRSLRAAVSAAMALSEALQQRKVASDPEPEVGSKWRELGSWADPTPWVVQAISHGGGKTYVTVQRRLKGVKDRHPVDLSKFYKIFEPVK